jgi:hypothetical protein
MKGKTKGLAAILDLPKDGGDKFYKFFNFKRVIDQTGIQQDKLYNNLKNEYHSLTDEDKKNIANVLMPPIKQLIKMLGYAVEFNRKK